MYNSYQIDCHLELNNSEGKTHLKLPLSFAIHFELFDYNFESHLKRLMYFAVDSDLIIRVVLAHDFEYIERFYFIAPFIANWECTSIVFRIILNSNLCSSSILFILSFNARASEFWFLLSSEIKRFKSWFSYSKVFTLWLIRKLLQRFLILFYFLYLLHFLDISCYYSLDILRYAHVLFIYFKLGSSKHNQFIIQFIFTLI